MIRRRKVFHNLTSTSLNLEIKLKVFTLFCFDLFIVLWYITWWPFGRSACSSFWCPASLPAPSAHRSVSQTGRTSILIAISTIRTTTTSLRVCLSAKSSTIHQSWPYCRMKKNSLLPTGLTRRCPMSKVSGLASKSFQTNGFDLLMAHHSPTLN